MESPDLKPASDYPESYYAATANRLPKYPELIGGEEADVCVIGGGFTGVSAALNLAEQGYSVVLLEAERIGFGASGRCGGLIGSGQRKDALEMEEAIRRRAFETVLGLCRGGQGRDSRTSLEARYRL